MLLVILFAASRLAVDLIAGSIYDIKEAFTRKRFTTFIMIDLESALNTVLSNRLIIRL